MGRAQIGAIVTAFSSRRACFSVLTHHPRARRYPFVATIELIDTQSEAKIQERTSDLSLYGCRVETRKPFPTGAKVRIRIAHRAPTSWLSAGFLTRRMVEW